MADIEKVIKGLQAHADGCGYRSLHCDAMRCPYRYGDEPCDIKEMCRDALELLKEQEAVKPRYIPPKSIYSWECGVCAEPFDRIANYCPKCGRKVKWEST